MTSLRRALLVRLVGSMSLLWVAATCAAGLGLRNLLIEQFDAVSRAKLESLAARVEQEGARVEFDYSSEAAPRYAPGPAPEYFELHVERGGLRSESLGDAALPDRTGPPERPAVWDLELPDGRRGRALGIEQRIVHYSPNAASDPGPERFRLIVARSRGELDGALRRLLLWALGSLPIAALAIGWFASRVIDRGLRPVDDLAAYARGVDDPARAVPLELARTPRELRPIAVSLDDLVRRLARRVERERRTSANIAHELRTPISELLMSADVALRYGDHPPAAREALGSVRETGLQMRELVSTLLELARIEDGALELEAEQLDLRALLEAGWCAQQSSVDEREITLEIRGEASARADPSMLAILIGNLLGNAGSHAPAGSTVRATLSSSPAGVELTLDNEAPELAPEQLEHLTEPFWQANASRDARQHSGLGLALCGRIAPLIDAKLDFELEAGRLCARLVLPL